MNYTLTISSECPHELNHYLETEKLRSALWEFSQFLREIYKYRELDEGETKLIEEIRDRFTDFTRYIED
jgi:hypothetical protein